MLPSESVIEQAAARHVENLPRTHDGQGHSVSEAPQCCYCLQSWPCEVRQLLDRITS
jgi:hypothetical protein